MWRFPSPFWIKGEGKVISAVYPEPVVGICVRLHFGLIINVETVSFLSVGPERPSVWMNRLQMNPERIILKPFSRGDVSGQDVKRNLCKLVF